MELEMLTRFADNNLTAVVAMESMWLFWGLALSSGKRQFPSISPLLSTYEQVRKV